MVVLAADHVHHAVLDHRGVQPALRRRRALRLRRAPDDAARVGEVGDVRRRAGVGGGPAGVVPDAAPPDPHAVLRVQHRGVLVPAHGQVPRNLRVEKRVCVQVQREQLADVEPEPPLHHEPAEDEHHVVVRDHRGGARARQRVRRARVLVRGADHSGQVERTLRGARALFQRRRFRPKLAPLAVVEPERKHGVQARVRLVPPAEHHQRALFHATKLDRMGRDHRDVLVPAAGRGGSGRRLRRASRRLRRRFFRRRRRRLFRRRARAELRVFVVAARLSRARPPRSLPVEHREIVRVREIVPAVPNPVPAVEERAVVRGRRGGAGGGERRRAGVILRGEAAEHRALGCAEAGEDGGVPRGVAAVREPAVQ